MTYDFPNIAEALEKVDALRAEIDAMRPIEPEQLGRAMQRLRLEWTYHSNAIEGNSLTYGETVALLMEGVTAHGKPLKDALDIQRHGEVLTYLEGVVRGKEQLTLADIRGMHRMLMGETYTVTVERPDGTRAEREETGGAFKEHPNSVLTPSGETHYYASPEETPALMQDLVDWYRTTWPDVESGKIPAVPFAADFHHRFVQIHPFADSNGRMGRILMNLMLMRRGYVPAVLRQEKRREYYGALNEADTGDLGSLIRFVAEELAGTMELFISAVRGEPDPTAFDKRVALLQREIDTSPLLGSLGQENLAELANQFIIPLHEKTLEHIEKIKGLFSNVSHDTIAEGTDDKIYTGKYVNPLLRSGTWLSFKSAWKLERLRADPTIDISIYHEGKVGGGTFSLSCVPGRDVKYSASSLPNSKEVDSILEEVFERVLDDIDAAAKQTRQPE